MFQSAVDPERFEAPVSHLWAGTEEMPPPCHPLLVTALSRNHRWWQKLASLLALDSHGGRSRRAGPCITLLWPPPAPSGHAPWGCLWWWQLGQGAFVLNASVLAPEKTLAWVSDLLLSC